MRRCLHLAAFFALFFGLQAAQPKCLNGTHDITLVIDGSKNVGSSNFQGSRIAVVVFDEKARVELGLTDATNASLAAAIHGIKYPANGMAAAQRQVNRATSDGVNIAAGMDAATRQIFNANNGQGLKKSKIMIIITGSNDGSDVRAERSLANEVGAIPIAIGIANGVNRGAVSKNVGASRDQLEKATGDPTHVLMTPDYSKVAGILAKMLCGDNTVQPLPDGQPKTARKCDCDIRSTWLDLVFVLDSSMAINKFDFYAVRNFAADFVKGIPVSQQQGPFSRVGIINVADTANVVGDLHAYADARSAYDAMRNVSYIGKAQMNLKAGLVAAQNVIDNANERPNVKKVVVVFTSKDELCTHQQSQVYNKEIVKQTKEDDSPCRIAAHLTINGNILLMVGLKFDGLKRFPQLNLGSNCFKFNFSDAFAEQFTDAICRANCYCLPPYVQYQHDETCTEYGECLYVQGQAVSHQVAEVTCGDYRASLVDVFSADKEAFITEIQAPHLISGSWLALQAVNGIYQWNGVNLTSVDYKNWAPSQPQPANGRCVAYEPQRGWVSKICDDMLSNEHFVCQKKSCDALNYCDFGTFSSYGVKKNA
ncbi:unnamed protein product [Toxocara canis]|uniref:Vitrin n=1 Tax=Toxocara canis TaxID=6265 RepID=A0A183TVR0_TOXCA|nr:unnamed protein product [Toxocara canis]